MQTVHGTTVAIDDTGVLLRGPSGSGKSDLALRLIDEGAMLVADDRSTLSLERGHLMVHALETIRNKIEVRGLGIVNIDARPQIQLGLVVDLAKSAERLPAPEAIDILGVSIPLIRLSAFEASSTAKIRLAVRARPDNIEA
jgi:HPr kinase/phosphorylase